jgi:hypothetical protein
MASAQLEEELIQALQNVAGSQGKEKVLFFDC